ncbi:hypothetical protein O9X98_09575 [Agrobacterium salinitolerans]|nr:hypothetical protein [Agrobacterium salinitolerans]
MKSRLALFALAASALLAGCTSPGSYYQPLIPRAEVGVRDAGGWSPYTPSQPARPEDREWRPANPDWGSSRAERREPAVRREALSEPVRNEERERRASPAAAESGSFSRAEPRDPPTDLSTRRVYSSRPERNPRAAPDESAFEASKPRNELVVSSRRGVRSEWADRAVREDNRPGFDKMVRDSASRGSGSFEDEAGRIYYGEAVGREDGCSVVEVTVTTNGGLPVVSRGTAYDCR